MDLLAQTEALEKHIKMLYDQNSLIEAEINQFIAEDDDLARKLENRRSESPVVQRYVRQDRQAIQTYGSNNQVEESFGRPTENPHQRSERDYKNASEAGYDESFGRRMNAAAAGEYPYQASGRKD